MPTTINKVIGFKTAKEAREWYKRRRRERRLQGFGYNKKDKHFVVFETYHR